MPTPHPIGRKVLLVNRKYAVRRKCLCYYQQRSVCEIHRMIRILLHVLESPLDAWGVHEPYRLQLKTSDKSFAGSCT
jgi:hypothetical protein